MKPELIIYIFWALAGLAALNFGYQVIKKRGLKGAIFGAPIQRTIGELDLGKTGPMSTKLKVHVWNRASLEPPRSGLNW